MIEDEFHGQGGSYTQDKRTGKRKLVERTGELPPADNPENPPVIEDKESV